jgi:hypothetical protein
MTNKSLRERLKMPEKQRVFIGLAHCRSMSAHAYTEDQLVEQPAIGLFAAAGPGAGARSA